MKNSFKDLNDKINPRLAEDATYIVDGFSFLKIFQHGLTYAYNVSSNKILRHYFDYPLWIQRILFKRSGPKNSINLSLSEVVIMDPGRPSEDAHSSYFFEKIKKHLSTPYTTINLKASLGLECTYKFEDVVNTTIPFDTALRNMHRRVVEVYNNLKRSNKYSSQEKQYISSALHVFFISFLRNYSLFQQGNAKRCFFIMHYHNEGLIAAGQALGIKMIEVQHGLIHQNDIYYCYDQRLSPALKNAFFPNEVLLFGEYWKKIVAKGGESPFVHHKIIGTVFPSQAVQAEQVEKENIILIASQKILHESYIRFIQALLPSIERHPLWRVIIKLHPAEKEIKLYETIQHPQVSIAPLQSSINNFLEKSKIQISLYSTTFFDAAGFNVVNFAWQGEGFGFDYAQQMAEDGIAEPLAFGEDVVAKYEDLLSRHYKYLNRTHFYAPFQASSLEN